jgi:hypothetical protein
VTASGRSTFPWGHFVLFILISYLYVVWKDKKSPGKIKALFSVSTIFSTIAKTKTCHDYITVTVYHKSLLTGSNSSLVTLLFQRKEHFKHYWDDDWLMSYLPSIHHDDILKNNNKFKLAKIYGKTKREMLFILLICNWCSVYFGFLLLHNSNVCITIHVDIQNNSAYIYRPNNQLRDDMCRCAYTSYPVIDHTRICFSNILVFSLAVYE